MHTYSNYYLTCTITHTECGILQDNKTSVDTSPPQSGRKSELGFSRVLPKVNRSNWNACTLRILPPAPSLPVLSIHLRSLSFNIKTTVYEGDNYKSMNLTKPGSYIKGYTNYYICIGYESSSTKNSLRNVKKVQITN